MRDSQRGSLIAPRMPLGKEYIEAKVADAGEEGVQEIAATLFGLADRFGAGGVTLSTLFSNLQSSKDPHCPEEVLRQLMHFVKPARGGFVTVEEFLQGFAQFASWVRSSGHRTAPEVISKDSNGHFLPKLSNGRHLCADARQGPHQSFPPPTGPLRGERTSRTRLSLDSSRDELAGGGPWPSRRSLDTEWHRQPPPPGVQHRQSHDSSHAFGVGYRHSDLRHHASPAVSREALRAASAAGLGTHVEATAQARDAFAFSSSRVLPTSREQGPHQDHQQNSTRRLMQQQGQNSDIEAIRNAARRSMDLHSRPAPFPHLQHQKQKPASKAAKTSKPDQQRHRAASRGQKSGVNAGGEPNFVRASDEMVESLRNAINSMDVGTSPGSKKKLASRYMYLRGDKSHKNLLRAEDMKSYVDAFQGISVADDGTVCHEDFVKHVKEVSPTLADHAMRMYENLVRRSKTKDGRVNAGAMLRVLFPAICQEDIKNIIEMVKTKPRRTEEQIRQERMLRMLDEAKELFAILDENDSGFLSRSEALDGVAKGIIDMSQVDLEEVFGKHGTSTDRPYVAFDTFYEWYSSSDLSTIMHV